ncbi:MAG TPA: response regulator transcription factor [Gemmataceae bacterium]|nr:response regulator transcription factor [Gemmataceae bacterium]
MTTARTILVVDDDAMLRAGLQTMLQQHGYQTLEAEDGLEARELIDGRRPDLVILDMMMPRWGGFAVLEHFQSKTGAPPFIMITAHEGQKHQAYARQIGAVDYIRKPFAFESLLARIDDLLRRSRPDEHPAPEEPREPSSIRLCCPGCGARIKAPLQLLGKKRSCPRCQFSLVIKPESPQDEGPRLLLDL